MSTYNSPSSAWPQPMASTPVFAYKQEFVADTELAGEVDDFLAVEGDDYLNPYLKKKEMPKLGQWDVDGHVYTGKYIEIRDGALIVTISVPSDPYSSVVSFATKDWKEVHFIGEIDQPEA